MLRVQVASVPDRESLVAELWNDGDMIAEVFVEAGRLMVEIYQRPGGGPWRIAYKELLRAFEEASHRLTTAE